MEQCSNEAIKIAEGARLKMTLAIQEKVCYTRDREIQKGISPRDIQEEEVQKEFQWEIIRFSTEIRV